MSNLWYLVPFLIGTAAFFVTLYITMFVPNMSDTPWNVDDTEEMHDHSNTPTAPHQPGDNCVPAP